MGTRWPSNSGAAPHHQCPCPVLCHLAIITPRLAQAIKRSLAKPPAPPNRSSPPLMSSRAPLGSSSIPPISLRLPSIPLTQSCATSPATPSAPPLPQLSIESTGIKVPPNFQELFTCHHYLYMAPHLPAVLVLNQVLKWNLEANLTNGTYELTPAAKEGSKELHHVQAEQEIPEAASNSPTNIVQEGSADFEEMVASLTWPTSPLRVGRSSGNRPQTTWIMGIDMMVSFAMVLCIDV
ncbi:uncharacterized protein LOC101769333 [Setaria italica]|uniref:uncharacterized protein LOC101769333 n=1 Tax=Setaria italica TaxID=4555 RepID=UPI000350C003|nr:uncharacterized protein LOC101769333 [Setaria italica]